MNYSNEDIKTMRNTCMNIFDFLKKEIAPNIKSKINYEFETEPSAYPISVDIYPASKGGFLSIHRTHINSSVYSAGIDYDKFNQNALNIFECNDVMFYLIKNWPIMKNKFILEIEHQNNNNFQR